MNVLTLVFSLLLILSYGFFASWDKHVASTQLKNSYVGHQKAHRKLMNSYQSEVYRKAPSHRSNPEHDEIFSKPTEKTSKLKIEPNRNCSKINLTPLVHEGKEKHPTLYKVTAKLIRSFYASLSSEKRFEYRLLDALLTAARENGDLPLEKLPVKNFERLYYKMLKGTKEWDLATRKGIPPFLDYVKLESQEQRICLFHAHPDLISVLFNPKVSEKLYAEIHKEEAPLLTQELVERICSETHLIALDSSLLALLEYGNPVHEETKKTFLAKDISTGITLRKQISFEH